MTLRAILIDDEELARAHLSKMLRVAGIDVVGEGESGVDALNLAESLRPDILFLDIQMPDMTGLQAAAAIENFEEPPRVVFVTGYSEYAIEAFERRAFDYLIKPVSPDRLARTIEHAKKHLATVKSTVEKPIDRELTPLQRLPVRTDFSIKLLKLEEIEYAVSRDKKVYVRTSGVEHRTYYTLTQLETLLPAKDFMRIHASAMVRLSLIESVNFLGNHTYSVTLTGSVVVPLGRTYYADLQARLGL
jgi:two-component system LytT family response regulator